jgi:hypothetical protein
MAPARKPRNREEMMIGKVRLIQLASAALGAYGLLVGATASAQGVKIGILNDQSAVYADYGGKGSIEAAKMAIEDFGGSVLGPKIDLVTPITRTSQISPATSRGAGTPKAST